MIELDWTLLAQIGNFLVLLILLNLVLFRPIRRALRDRQKRLAAAAQEAESILAQAQGVKNQVQESLTAAKREGLGQKEKLRQEGAQGEASLLEQVKAEVDAQWVQVEKKIKEDMAKARKALHDQAKSFAQIMAAKILGREVS
jgi:F-type H+-transporting ATPase subunit b